MLNGVERSPAAERHLLEGIERAAQLGSVVVDVPGDIRLARLKQAQGDLAGALDLFGG